MSMTSASIAICAARPRRRISNGMTTAAIPTSTSSRKRPRRKRFAKRRWKAARSRRSAITAPSVVQRRSATAEMMAKSHRRRSPIFAALRRGRRSAATVPVALTIAGSDCSAGAGIQADLKTFHALGVYGLTAVTCVVAEIPGKVSRIEPLKPDIVREQIRVLATSFPIAAIKTGLLCSAEIVAAVAQAIGDFALNIPLIVDPVMIATSGDALLARNAINVYENALFPAATLITPNVDEAAKLLGKKAEDRQSMQRAAQALARKYGTAVLVKGGHVAGAQATDVLAFAGKLTEFSARFVPDIATHGTGCAYSAAIAAALARGETLERSIQRAKEFVTSAIAQHFRWRSYRGKNVDALNHLL
jgi:hydroxymethylpyrimidine/phosphomethylpyrimidine kinase